MFNQNTQGIYTFLANQLYNISMQTSMKDVHITFGIAIGFSSGRYLEHFSDEQLTRYQELAKVIMQQTELNIVRGGWL